MGLSDKISNKAQDLKGKAKVAGGKGTGDKGMARKGKVDQRSAALKGVGEKVKDALKK